MSLLDEISSWMNVRAISNQFSQKINVCFVYLQEHDKKHSKILSGFCKLTSYTNCVLIFPCIDSRRKRGTPRELVAYNLECSVLTTYWQIENQVWEALAKFFLGLKFPH
jgi:hypothetical protein